MLSLFTLRSLPQLSKRTYEFRLAGGSSPGRTASQSQPQHADLVEDRIGRAGPTRLQIKTSGQTTRPRATCSRSTSIMPHGSRFGQSRSSPPPGSPPAPPGSVRARRRPARLARSVSIVFRSRSLTRPLMCSRSSSSTKELATYGSLLGLPDHSTPNRRKPAATTS